MFYRWTAENALDSLKPSTPVDPRRLAIAEPLRADDRHRTSPIANRRAPGARSIRARGRRTRRSSGGSWRRRSAICTIRPRFTGSARRASGSSGRCAIGETILIYGDYDVDGVTSIVLLQTVLRALGADAAHVVPHRLVDGYGLKTAVIDRVLAERDVRLIITVDCGITSVDPVRQAIERGIDVIVTDHHLPPELLPEAAAVLNPKQPGCAYPFKELAGVGVAFKLCCELLRRSGKKMSIASLLKIAAIGTVADVAPLDRREPDHRLARSGRPGRRRAIPACAR